MTKVLIADDKAVVRSGLRMILEAQDDIEVVEEVGDGRTALVLIGDLDPDVVLMDIRMPVLDGIETTRRIATSGARPRVIVLTTYGLDENVYAALKVGAAGFLVKTDSLEELIKAVRAVGAGESLLGRETTQRLMEHFLSGPSPNTPPPPELATLTDRELEVLKLVARGLSNAEVAQTLYVSEGTIKTHVARFLAKLGLRDRVQAVVFVYECGLIKPRQPRPSRSGEAGGPGVP
jgi:DNA-binding NarL/FixJ family response regulator